MGKYHYQSYLFLLKSTIINKFVNHYKSKQHLIHNQESVIKHLELSLIHIDKNHDCFLKIAKEYNNHKNLYWENEELYENMVTRNIFHLFKIKKIMDHIKFHKNELGKYTDEFNLEYYKNTYPDLKNLNDDELLSYEKLLISGDPRIWRLSIDIEQSDDEKENIIVELIKNFKGF